MTEDQKYVILGILFWTAINSLVLIAHLGGMI